MVVRMRHTRAHTANRRSHHALKLKGMSLCDKCGSAKKMHIVCVSCGHYRGKKVIDVVKKVTKKQKKTKGEKTEKVEKAGQKEVKEKKESK